MKDKTYVEVQRMKKECLVRLKKIKKDLEELEIQKLLIETDLRLINAILDTYKISNQRLSKKQKEELVGG
jgi:predicted phage-related endonuclease